MGLFKKMNVFLSINDRSIRYLVCPAKQSKGTIDDGELFFDKVIMEDGRIINEAQLKSQVKMLVEQKNWKGAKLSFIVPDSFLTMRTEEIPNQLEKEEAKRYIRLQLEGSIRLPFKNPMIDFEVLTRGEDTNEILLFAYPEERLKPFYRLFENASLNAEVADVSFLSAYRTYQVNHQPDDNEHLLMIQWNKVDLVLTVFHKKIPKFTRHVHASNPFQEWKLDSKEATLVSQSSPEELEEARDQTLITIERFMDFYQYSIMDGETAVTNILLLGDHPDLAKLQLSLDERFDLSIEILTLPQGLPMGCGVLYGLSLKTESKPKKRVKLKKEHQKEKKSDNKSKAYGTNEKNSMNDSNTTSELSVTNDE